MLCGSQTNSSGNNPYFTGFACLNFNNMPNNIYHMLYIIKKYQTTSFALVEFEPKKLHLKKAFNNDKRIAPQSLDFSGLEMLRHEK